MTQIRASTRPRTRTRPRSGRRSSLARRPARVARSAAGDLDLAASDVRRLAVVEDDREAAVRRDRVGGPLTAACDEHAPPAKRIPRLQLLGEPREADVEPLPVAMLEL